MAKDVLLPSNVSDPQGRIKDSPAVLRNWKILSNWSEEELEKVVFANIFDTENAPYASNKQCALLLTNDDEVYFVGPAHPLFGGSNEDKLKKTRVEKLSGLRLKVLTVGYDFCLALTKDHDLYFWSYHTPIEIPDSAFVFYELYNSSTARCSNHSRSYSQTIIQYEFAGVKFNFGCAYGCKAMEVENEKIRLLKFREALICCTKCRRRCTPYKIRDHEVNYCAFCNYLPVNAKYCIEPTDETLDPKLMDFSESNEVVDIACGLGFFVALTKQNNLLLWGQIGPESEYRGTIYNPDKVIVKEFSCGALHVAVVTVAGDLYTCGQGNVGQLGYNWTPEMGHITLRKVPLNGKVVKACCGYSSTVSLMDDGSLMCFGSHMKMLSPGVLALNQLSTDYISEPARIMQTYSFTEITNCSLTNIYFASTDAFSFVWGREFDKSNQPELLLRSERMAAVADLPTTLFFKAPCSQKSTVSPHLDCELYGKKFLSDLTLKLSDGDFPAHRLVLHTNSAYFRDTFGQNDSECVLDMTHYNPEAYRCLLKYFYQVPPTDLSATDLLDLYELANSYKEAAIAQEVFAKLKAILNADTVLPLLRRAKEVNCSEFLDECNTFIKAPEFKHILAEKVSEDMEKTLSLLEVFNDKK